MEKQQLASIIIFLLMHVVLVFERQVHLTDRVKYVVNGLYINEEKMSTTKKCRFRNMLLSMFVFQIYFARLLEEKLACFYFLIGNPVIIIQNYFA
jgi:hypothetical protein